MRQRGQHITVQAGVGGDRVSRQRKDRSLPLADPEPERLARPLVDPLDDPAHSLAVQLGGQEVELPLGNPAGDQHHVKFRHDVPEQVLDLGLHVAQVKPLNPGIAGGHQRGAERVVVAPPDLVRGDHRIHVHQFVSSRDDGDPGGSAHRQ